ncbi:MAG: hypothetical protein ABR526_13205 [Chthoniobacterales bacterium]
MNSGALIVWGAIFGLMRGFVSAASAQVSPIDSATPLEERIRRVEAGLLPAIVIKGSPSPAQPLVERMKFYRVPGVSVKATYHGLTVFVRCRRLLRARRIEGLLEGAVLHPGRVEHELF